jgi:hypothetical protein
MHKLFASEKLIFFVKVIAAHIITYMVMGQIAFNLLYHEVDLSIMGFKPIEEIKISTIIIGQIIRGILLGIVIWWIKGSIIGKKLGWLKLWAILAILGIFNTYGPASGSIEGLIYLDLARFEGLPPIMNLSILEVLVQPLLFSIIVTFERKKKEI